MRHFIIHYNSEVNLFKGTVHISAMTVHDAQDKFLKWLREQPAYTHLWQLRFEMTEIKASL